VDHGTDAELNVFTSQLHEQLCGGLDLSHTFVLVTIKRAINQQRLVWSAVIVEELAINGPPIISMITCFVPLFLAGGFSDIKLK
jgi:hypothetical protein